MTMLHSFVRVGDESVPATAEQMVRLVLKGSNKTFDSLHTDYKAEDYSFTILANSFKDRTKQEWDKKYLLSFGLVTGAGHLTNAGALFADDSPLWQSRLYCTRWDGTEKGDAINDAEFTGNVLMLLREAMNFVKSNTKRGWEKLPDGRKNQPNSRPSFLPLPTPRMSEIMSEMCRRQNSLSVSRKSSISSKNLRQ